MVQSMSRLIGRWHWCSALKVEGPWEQNIVSQNGNSRGPAHSTPCLRLFFLFLTLSTRDWRWLLTFFFFFFSFFELKAAKAVFQGQMQVLPLKVCLVQTWVVQAEPTWKILHNQWEKRMRVYACCTSSKLILLTQIVFPARSTTQNFIKARHNNSVMQETELLFW